MKKPLLIVIAVTLIFSIFFPTNANAGSKAGVGVLNVPPEYNIVRLVQQDNTIRVYLTLSDYNSWEDIFEVNIILEYYGSEIARFIFNQYADATSYQKINEFSESSGEENLLQTDKCSYSHSDEKETVEDRCNFELLFVFRTTWFTQFKIVVSDREGATATTQVDYSAEDMMRSSNMIMIPGLDGPIPVEVSALVVNIISIAGGAIGVFYLTKKLDIVKMIGYGKAE